MIKIRSPGRICLFGEHQDYLGFPVISLAISKYIFLEAKKITKPRFLIHFPDIDVDMEVKLDNKELTYDSNRDYVKSGYNHYIRKGIKFSDGYEIIITGNIPINAGVGSSSALVIAWLHFLAIISNQKIDPYRLALQGYAAEVEEFNEAGGMMDHFSSVFGKLIILKSQIPEPILNFYDLSLEGFILGNSMERKSTVEDLKNVKELSLHSFEILKEMMPSFNMFKTSLKKILPYLESIKKIYKEKIIGNLNNRDITLKAKILLDEYYKNKENYTENQRNHFYNELGSLLNSHHQNLRDNIGVSTKKIEEMVRESLKNGALGSKINGSGFGGTMFALAPENEQKIVNRLESLGYESTILKTSKGVESY
jgi:galactokinase